MDENDLKFPLTCHFRVVTRNLPNMHFVIETVMMELGVVAPVEEANTSAGGNYISFNISTVVESRDHMTKIDKELRLIEGVKMVL